MLVWLMSAALKSERFDQVATDPTSEGAQLERILARLHHGGIMPGSIADVQGVMVTHIPAAEMSVVESSRSHVPLTLREIGGNVEVANAEYLVPELKELVTAAMRRLEPGKVDHGIFRTVALQGVDCHGTKYEYFIQDRDVKRDEVNSRRYNSAGRLSEGLSIARTELTSDGRIAADEHGNLPPSFRSFPQLPRNPQYVDARSAYPVHMMPKGELHKMAEEIKHATRIAIDRSVSTKFRP